MNNKYNIGDKIKIRGDLIKHENYGLTLNSFMYEYIGKETKITNITNCDDGIYYKLKIDDGYWYWTEKMLEDIGNNLLDLALDLLGMNKDELEYKFEKEILFLK